jgi:hypothetical protein
VELARITLTGGPVRAEVAHGAVLGPGLLGVDVAERAIDGRSWTVVQLLLDDDDPAFDRALLDCPMVATVLGGDGAVLVREPLDHDRFRRQLRYERDRGESFTRGMLVTTGGQLPPPWIRLAFLPLDLAATAAAVLTIERTSVAALQQGAEDAYARGEITDAERVAVLTAIEQRHPPE